ncbi:transcriptional activator of glycolytic enzymes-domain-containing protein [Halteromyces radiatus]|uniref:transcriptional activator of glycolytic enzymes-domain-containing protein n=1 Tax=Halteromyces radiatus TaxID=101107 RepID=UPI00221F9552|nr:transcriptional activator of glycolytic enzymes-domain-containing protein [Halteromyces radiatus]KAI8099487.1 transcriptional activator of glycolytic enzymes-domain-containing protein [Halteromyces radiatus]
MIQVHSYCNVVYQSSNKGYERSTRIYHVKMEAHRSTSSTTNDYISQLVTGRATLSLNINFNDGNSSIVATSTPVPSSHQHVSTSSSPSMPNTDDQVPPLYRMNRALKSLGDLWREWYVGLAGGYAVDDLEKRWGSQWRKDSKERKFYSRRRRIIDQINKYSVERNVSTRTALERAEERRARHGYSLHYLGENPCMIYEDMI